MGVKSSSEVEIGPSFTDCSVSWNCDGVVFQWTGEEILRPDGSGPAR